MKFHDSDFLHRSVSMEITTGLLTEWYPGGQRTHCYYLLSFPVLTDFILLYQVGDGFHAVFFLNILVTVNSNRLYYEVPRQ